MSTFIFLKIHQFEKIIFNEYQRNMSLEEQQFSAKIIKRKGSGKRPKILLANICENSDSDFDL